jgi:hypothetical protein
VKSQQEQQRKLDDPVAPTAFPTIRRSGHAQVGSGMRTL